MNDTDGLLTVLLPVKDRAAYTLRWLSYAAQVRFPFRILIADGGRDASLASILADRRRFSGVTYEYVRYRADDSYTDYYAKLEDATTRIRTPYVVMLDSDDFLLADGLRRAVQFLESHPTHVACGGQFALFWVDGAGAGRDVLYGQQVEWKAHSADRSNDAERARERLRELAEGESETCYFLVKRAALIKAQHQCLRELDLCDLFLVEVLIYFLTTIAGKVERFDALQIARQLDSPSSSGGEHEMSAGDGFGRMLLPTWSADFEKFLRVTSAVLVERDGLTLEEAQSAIVSAYRAYTAIPLLDALVGEPTLTTRNALMYPLVRSLMGRLAVPSVANRARGLLRRLFRGARWIPYQAAQGGRVIVNRVPGAAGDFASVRDFLARGPSDDIGPDPSG